MVEFLMQFNIETVIGIAWYVIIGVIFLGLMLTFTKRPTRNVVGLSVVWPVYFIVNAILIVVLILAATVVGLCAIFDTKKAKAERERKQKEANRTAFDAILEREKRNR